uniref:Discs, large homolog 5a (Drosophila) n=1 Tax=Hucho hucho TaxID=62062 RepID=A0A4W5MSX0_9TELE
MEPKHKELLDQFHQNLLDSITDADRLIELLILSGTLSQLDRFELDQNCSSSAEKVDQLLKMLVNKESDHFLELCVALEKAYPDLYSALFTNGGGPVDHSSGKAPCSTYSVLSTMPSDSESSSSLSSPPGNGSASSPPPAVNDNRPAGDNLDTILFQLRQVTRERDELRKRLALASPGTTFDDCRPNSKASHDYERLKSQCMRAMADLQSLQNQHTKTLKRCEEAVKEADFYHMLHSRVLGDQSQLKEELDVLRRDHTQLVREHNHLKQSCEELRRLHSEDQKEVADMRRQQQEVMRENGSSEVLNKLYDTAMDKLEGVRKEYDSLSKRYSEKVANHNTDLSRLEQVEEENRRLQKQMDTLLRQRDTAIHYQQQLKQNIYKYIHYQQQLKQNIYKYIHYQQPCSTSEDTHTHTMLNPRYMVIHTHTYTLLHTSPSSSIPRFDSVQQELNKSSGQNKELQREMERLQSEKQDSATLDIERANKEIEVLRKQYEAMSQELKEATQEAEVAKCRRDWAFQERDKIVAERESIRTLCDNLRRERDRAVSDLADALRNLDDMRKQKNDSSRELKELKEKMESQLDKEARFCQLMAHSSHDSAIDTDSLEWETEVVEFEKDRDDMDLKALGFDIAEGVNDPYLPGDCGIFVTRVDKGSIADGRLRVNDWLLKINDMDLTNKDRKQVVKAVLDRGGLINMVVRRRKSLGGRLVTPVHINLIGHKDSGIGLESGVFVTALVQGSPASREGSLTVGDRLLAINGIALDNKSVTECETLLRNCRDSLSLSLMKFFPHSSSGQNIFDSLRESSSNSRLSEVHSRNSRNLKHNSSTQTDIFCPDTGGSGGGGNVQGERRKCGGGEAEEGMGPYGDVRKPFSTGSLHATSLRPSSDLATTPTQLSIFKSPKQRKSIFDTDAFKPRPETAPPSSKMEYLLPSQLVAHSPQPSKTESLSSSSTATSTPPPPPTRSDSFKFKHKQQSNSTSDCTLTSDGNGGKGGAVSMVTGDGHGEREREREREKERDRNGNHYFLDGKVLTSRKSCDEDIGRTRGEEPEVKRPRPKSAPALRRRMTPQSITLPSFQVSLMFNEESVCVCVCVCVSPQHQGRLSLDLSQKCPAADYSESSSRSSRTSHGTNSLPSSARLDSSSNVQYRNERIKIPSTPRYPRSMLGSDRGSLSHSECSSPSLITPPQSPLNLETSSFTSSQSQSSISTLPRVSVSPVPIGERRKDRPYLEEPRNVIVHKGAEPLGISIVSGENGGIFVSKVTGGSIAHQAGLEYGDQLLEYNGINLRNATEQQARLIIGQQCDTITIMAQYNPHMYQLGNHSRSSSGLEPVNSQSTPQGSGATTPDNHSTIDTLSEQDEGTLTPSSKQTTPTTKGSRKACEPRVVTVRRAQGAELGLGLCGGNLRGVYVESLEEDSPARGTEGLQPGDLILEYGSVNMKNKTVEEVYVEMLKPAETVTLKVQQRQDDFNIVKDTPGDGFYIRALYERIVEAELDLSFKKDDILYVDDTLPKGSFGTWMAWQLDENAQQIQRGQIPSKYMMDQEFYRRHSMTELKDDKDSKSLSAAARRSFFRRKHKHKRSGSKDGKELVALDAISTDSIPFLEDCVSLAYQRVQKVECASPRPVLILGPLSDPVKDMLVKESPRKFCRCVLEVMKASQQAIERGVKDCLFIDYKRRSGHFDVTTVASIKEITDKDCHCLLDIAPHAIERLHSVHIYPIVIFIRYKNSKQIKEQKDPVYLRDKVSQKHSKEQFEVAQKIEQEYSKFFTGIVQGGTLPYICTQIMTIVDQEQSKVLWTPLGCS